jgi:hypothetical protein
MSFESARPVEVNSQNSEPTTDVWAQVAQDSYRPGTKIEQRTLAQLIPVGSSGALEPRPTNPIEPRIPEQPKTPENPKEPTPPPETPNKPEPPKEPTPPPETPDKPEPPKEPTPPPETPKKPEPPKEPTPPPEPPPKVERPHFKLPPVEMPEGNFFKPIVPKPEVSPIVTPEPSRPRVQTTEVIQTPPKDEPNELVIPPGVFTGEGPGGRKRIATIVPQGQEKTREWIEIPKLNTGKIVVDDVGTGREQTRKLPATVNINDAVPPSDPGAVGEWNRKIPGKEVNLAHGQLGDKNGPFGNLEKLKPGDIIRRNEDGAIREFRVTEVDTIKRDDANGWKRAFSATPKGSPDQWVGITCIGDKDKHGLSLDRTVVYAEAVDGRSTQDNGRQESKLSSPISERTELRPAGKVSEVIVPSRKASDLGGSISISGSAISGKESQQLGEVRLQTPDITVGITSNPSVHIEKNIPLINTENDKLIITPGVGYNLGEAYPTSTYASIVGKGTSLDLSATYAHRLNDQGASLFVRGGGSYQPSAEFKSQWFVQTGAEVPIGEQIKVMGGIGVQGASTDATNPRVADTSVGPFAKISYDINKSTQLSLKAQEAGGNSKVTLETKFSF